MNSEQFKEVVVEMVTQCHDLLNLKEQYYSDGQDRLVQFKTAAQLRGITPTDALAGMMVKHTTKLYQMLQDEFGKHTQTEWEEVLNDHVNYHFLLKALLIDEGAI